MPEKKKHILILSSWYPNRNSPFLGNFVKQHAELLSSKYKVTVLFTIADPLISEHEITIQETGDLQEIVIYHPKGKNIFSRRREQDKAFDNGLKLIDSIDLIHAHVLLPKGYLFVKAKKNFDCPLFVTEHGSYYREEYRKKMSLKEKFILNFTKKHIDQLICVSDFLKKDIEKYFEKMEIKVIPNPINTELFTPNKLKKNNTKQFLHISTLDRSLKNPQGIIDSIILLKQKGYTDFTLTIISDEPYNELQKSVVENGIEAYVKFYGSLKPEELVPFYQQSDAFVLFSIYETFSIVLAEAWACGVPTLTTSVGIGNDLNSDLGIQVKINDPLSLAMAMEKIINGLEFNSDEIRKHALQFSNENVLNQLSELYKGFNG